MIGYDGEVQPRMWKWMLPSIGVFALFLVGIVISLFSEQIPLLLQLGCQCGVIGSMVICAAAGISGYRQYFNRLEAETLEIRQLALAITADSVLLEKAQNVHPQTLQILLAERNRAWMVVSGSTSPDRTAYSVLKAAPQVTDKFIEFFLDNSTDEQAMSKRVLVEGRKNMFDPSGQTDEYTMYDLFEQVLIQERKLTKPYGNLKPGMWIPPWSPESVARDLGWDWSPSGRQQTTAGTKDKPAWEKALDDLEQTDLMKKATKK